MTSVLMAIKALYPQMGRGEKRIADWILVHPQQLIGMSISELANVCGCGDATIVRFSRRLGQVGYQGLKISIAQELSANGSPAEPDAVLRSDSCFDIFRKRESEISAALEYTRSVLDRDAMDRAAEALMHAGNIAIFGLGNSAPIAVDAQHKFLRAGLYASAYCDNHMQAIAASHLKPGDVALGISHSGSSVDVVSAMRLAREAGAFTVCITNYGASPITRQSDVSLFTKAEETRYSILALSSRIAQLCIIDAIYTYIINHSDRAAMEAIRETERALEEKKF
ncbi:MAG: MurR/RpiR family transcriptional regulator [Ruminococcaceae bacterium]|nr:MurR/RpiR family transcriptional regulator [Oscillospiraceae bacterium]